MDAFEYTVAQRKAHNADPNTRHARAFLGPNMTEMQGAVTISSAPNQIERDIAANLVQPGQVYRFADGQVPDFHHSDVEPLLDERHKTHGSFRLNAYWGQELRELFRRSPGWHNAELRQREALDYIAGKLARILSGQPGFADHWDDIAGYAKLAAHPDLQR